MQTPTSFFNELIIIFSEILSKYKSFSCEVQNLQKESDRLSRRVENLSKENDKLSSEKVKLSESRSLANQEYRLEISQMKKKHQSEKNVRRSLVPQW